MRACVFFAEGDVCTLSSQVMNVAIYVVPVEQPSFVSRAPNWIIAVSPFDCASFAGASAPAAGVTSSVIFHGKETHDYQGRCWVEPPKGVHPDDGDHECFVPKKPLHKWTGHNKGVQSIQFFPGTGHLLLSGE